MDGTMSRPDTTEVLQLVNMRALGAVLFGAENADGPFPDRLVRVLDACRRGEYRYFLNFAVARPWVTDGPTYEDDRFQDGRHA